MDRGNKRPAVKVSAEHAHLPMEIPGSATCVIYIPGGIRHGPLQVRSLGRREAGIGRPPPKTGPRPVGKWRQRVNEPRKNA